jgi:hypothetical protein
MASLQSSVTNGCGKKWEGAWIHKVEL